MSSVIPDVRYTPDALKPYTMFSTGVAMVPPPPGPIFESIHEQVSRLVSSLPENASGAILSVDTTSGVNFAVVKRFDEHWSVEGFIGKKWGEGIVGGGSVRVIF